MAMTDYKFFPNAGTDDLNSTLVRSLGVNVGDEPLAPPAETPYVEYYYALKFSNPRTKWCYYKRYSASVPGITFYDVAVSIKRENAETSGSLTWGRANKRNDMTGWGYADTVTNLSYNANYDGILYGSLYHYFDDTALEPDVPIYDDLATALDKMNDNIWSGKEKYSEGGYSTTGGGFNFFKQNETAINFSTLPIYTVKDIGCCRLYSPTIAQLDDFFDFLWSDFDIDSLKKMFLYPMEAILGLTYFPFTIATQGTRNLKLGNVATDVSMNVLNEQYMDFSCGQLNLFPEWDAYLDYSPYSKLSIYLPFLGFRELDIDEVLNRSVLEPVYHIDLLSGAFVIEIKVGSTVMYTFQGSCGAQIPITQSNYNSSFMGVVQTATAIGGLVASGGATFPSAINNIASATSNMLKPEITKSGSFSGAGCLLCNKTPYLLVTRPEQCLPKNQHALQGYPAFIYMRLGALEGYTEVESVELTGFDDFSESEIDEIRELLKGGVIL